MDYSTAINNKTLKKNVGEVLSSTDKNNDTIYNREEIKDGIKGAVSIFGKPFINNKVVDSVMNVVDKNKDDKVTLDEINSFLQEKYGMTLDEAKQMNVKDLVDQFQEIDKAKKKEKKD